MSTWAALVGRAEDGRREATAAVVEALRAEGLRVGGFVQQRVLEGDEVVGWDAVDLAGGSRCPVARTGPDPHLCEWRFDAEGIEACRRWATAPDLDVVVLEAGPLEARGEGHWDTLQEILRSPGRVALVGLRPSALAAVALALPDPIAGLELPGTPEETAELANAIAREARAANRG